MNILLITPVYKIEGRETLDRNTEAVHYLVKYWANDPDVDIKVVDTYLNPARNIMFLLKKGEWKNFRNDYEYEVDGIPVHLTEIQQFPAQKYLSTSQNNKILRAIQHFTTEKQWTPDIIVVHFAVRYLGMINELPFNVRKVAVMHITDVIYCKRHPEFIEKMNASYDVITYRSAALKKECENLGLEHLSDFIVNSGAPLVAKRREHDIEFHNSNTIHILYVGRLIERKHADYIILALGRLKKECSFDLTIIGKGEEKEKLSKLTVEAGIDSYTTFIDSVPRDAVYDYMGQSDIFIMPSTGETLGLVYLEAMAQGCITIGTMGEGIDGIIKNGVNGFLVKPGDPESVYRVLKEVFALTNNRLRDISKEAVETAKLFNEENVSRAYSSFLKGIVESESI